MNDQLNLVGAVALLAVLLLAAVFQLQDRAGEPPARRAFQAMFLLHFVLLCSLVAGLSVAPPGVVMETLIDASLAGMYGTMVLGIVWRSRSSFPVGAIVGVSLAYFLADMVLDGVAGMRAAMVYIALANAFCAAIVWRRPTGANFGDVAMAGVFAGWTLVNLAGLALSITSALQVQETMIFLLSLSPAFFAGFGVFLVVSYMLDGQKDLIALSNTDPLTGLCNRRFLIHRSKEILSSALRRREPVSLIELDIDRFKSINDDLGHHCGDLALKAVASILEAHTRVEDVAARVGGEEFVILMRGQNGEGAVTLAERIRQAIEAVQIDWKDTQFRCTASFGVVTALAGGISYEALLARADDLLYRAKEEGRNRIVSTELPSMIRDVTSTDHPLHRSARGSGG